MMLKSLAVLLLAHACSAHFMKEWKGNFRKLGAYTMACESSPFVWNSRVYIMESHCPDDRFSFGKWNSGFSGHSYFGIRDLITGMYVQNVSASIGYSFFSVYVDNATATPILWVFATSWDRQHYETSACGRGDCYIQAFWTLDLLIWSSGRVFNWPKEYSGCNTAVTFQPSYNRVGRYVMMIDSTNTSSPVIHGWFAERTAGQYLLPSGHVDLTRGWRILPLSVANASDLAAPALKWWDMYDIGACPAMRYNTNDGHFYMTSGGDIVPVARSKDLLHWDMSPQLFLYSSPQDVLKAPVHQMVWKDIDAIYFASPQIWDGWNSDADYIELDGQTWIIWWASSQGTIENTQYWSLGFYNGTLFDLYESYFTPSALGAGPTAARAAAHKNAYVRRSLP